MAVSSTVFLLNALGGHDGRGETWLASSMPRLQPALSEPRVWANT